jgi:hypothetical protein
LYVYVRKAALEAADQLHTFEVCVVCVCVCLLTEELPIIPLAGQEQ